MGGRGAFSVAVVTLHDSLRESPERGAVFPVLTRVLFPKVLQLLKAGKAKEVSYNALASHIISEDGDNPEVGEAREVFDLPVVKVGGTPGLSSKLRRGCGDRGVGTGCGSQGGAPRRWPWA